MLRNICFAAALAIWVVPDASVAQEANESSTEYSVLDAVEPPVGTSTENYRSIATRARARTKAVYATELKGDLAGKRAREQPVKVDRPRRERWDLNGFGVLLAVGLLVGALFLLMKFGGGGALLARDPRDNTKRKHETPESWNIGDEAIKDADGLLGQIALMSDRTAAMVLLLRHSLVAGARSTDARFARSDTERLAFARLPDHWIHHARLQTMLQHTELAHYGGRDVTAERFEDALNTARRILTHAKGAAHV